MKVKEVKSEGLSHELEITIPANDIDARVEDRLKEVGKTIRMPGFRPGKVPLDILKKRYGKAIMGEVLEKAVNETSAKALEDKKLKPAMQPKIEVKSFDDGKDLVYTLGVEVLPELKIGNFKGLKLEKPVAEVEDKAVKEALDRIAGQNRTTKAIEGKRASKKGDVVIIDFNGRTADDNFEHPGMQAQGHRLELGGGQFIAGFEDQLTGKKAGDSVEVKVSFPENYGAPELSGRDAIFDVEIQEIHEYQDSKVDDEFAKKLGLEDKKALDKAVKEQIQKEYDQHSRLKVKKALLDQLDDMHDIEVPKGMMDMEYENILRQVEMDYQQRNPGGDEKISDTEKDELKDIAGRRVRLGLILSEIGQSNNIVVTDPELQRAVITEAQRYPGQEKEVFDYYSKNRQALESLRAPLFEDKVVDFILELADIKEKKVSIDELTAEEDETRSKPKAKKSAAKTTDKKPAAKKDEKKAEPKKDSAKSSADKKPAAKKPAAKKK